MAKKQNIYLMRKQRQNGAFPKGGKEKIIDVAAKYGYASTWAIFPGTGTSQSVQELERRIFTEWFPTSGYEYGDAPDIEVYIDPDPQNTIFEVWVPVKKKQS